MVAHKAAFDAGEVECLVILVVVIFGAEVFIPVAGHILLEESYKVFEKFEAILSQFIAELAAGYDDTPVGVVAHTLAVLPEADIDVQTSLVNTDADAICVNGNQKCSDFGNSECSIFGIKTTVLLASAVQ